MAAMSSLFGTRLARNSFPSTLPRNPRSPRAPFRLPDTSPCVSIVISALIGPANFWPSSLSHAAGPPSLVLVADGRFETVASPFQVPAYQVSCAGFALAEALEALIAGAATVGAFAEGATSEGPDALVLLHALNRNRTESTRRRMATLQEVRVTERTGCSVPGPRD